MELCLLSGLFFLDGGGRASLTFANVSLGRSAMGRLGMRTGSRPRANRTPLTRSSPSTSRVKSTLVAVVLVRILLPVMAFASPPDPSWIAGIYDGADGDDVVMLVYETTATSAPAPSLMFPFPCLQGLSTTKLIFALFESSCAEGSRAPPAMLWPVPVHVSTFPTGYTPTASATKFPLVTPRRRGVRRATPPTLVARMF